MKSCPDHFSAELSGFIDQFAQAWAKSSDRPSPNPDICKKWDELLCQWISDPALPLFIRVNQGLRGQKLNHDQHHVIVRTDNSPAQWVYSMACNSLCPTFEQLKSLLSSPEISEESIPVAMIFTREEFPKTDYKTTLQKQKKYDLNLLGWKLAHIQGIGLRKQGPIEKRDIKELKAHHLLFLSPSNMYVIPKKLAGLAEIPAVSEAIRTWSKPNE